jgi:NAD(P)-dependent dehydrogenase (short-subunit alcohol dehydrogenase family)
VGVSYGLDGRVALVTGAARSIGEACARRLAECGAHVVVADIDAAGAERVTEEIRSAGGQAMALAFDVTDSAAVDAGVATVLDQLGGLQIAVNNAGVTSEGALTGDLTDEGWRAIQAVNLDGVFHCLRAEIRAMRERGGGSIVNMASILSSAGFKNHVAYTASKHAVVGLTRGAAVDHAEDGIRVNAVAPGFIRTPLIDVLTPEEIEAVALVHPLGRLGVVGAGAEMVAWLASDASSFATGSVYNVDGGYLAV